MAELLLNQNRGVKTYLVKDSEWGRPVIKKVLEKDTLSEEEIRQFTREYELLDSLEFKGIRKNLRNTVEQGKPVLYFDYFEGFTLKQVAVSGDMSYGEVLNYALSISEILHTLHDIKLVHRNINSHNLLVNPEDKSIQLIDFSMANKVNEKKHQLGNPNILEGDLGYISPEQTGRMNRQIDTRSDLYSLGVVIYEMLTGRLPFITNDPLEMVHSHLAKHPPSVSLYRPDVPDVLERIILKLLQKNPEERYQSVAGLHYDLLKCNEEYKAHRKFPDLIPGRNDVSPILHISQKLYGRHREIKFLKDAFHRVIGGRAGIVMVNGQSGVGKTAVVHEVFSDISWKKGYFIQGKFDQLQRNIPYYALVNAFREYVNYVIIEEAEEIRDIRKIILNALGKESWVLTEILPSLELIIGKQEKGEELSGMEAQNRFSYVFGNFVKAISRKENPLVLFIDDLQWADPSSLSLLQNLLRDSKLENLLFIGSYRSNEVGETHNLSAMLTELEQEHIYPEELTIENLSEKNIHDLLSDTFKQDLPSLDRLAGIIFGKTRGNAFHVIQVIKLLYEKDIIYLDTNRLKWMWDEDKVARLDLTDNVIDVLVLSLKRLESGYLEILKYAACIGNVFKSEYLYMLPGGGREIVNEALETARQEGYINKRRDEYVFVHDRIQQTLYSFLDDDRKKKLHLRIGEMLLERLSDLEETIFDIVNQINEGIDLVSNSEHRIRYGKLNLKAGQKARSSSAFDSAYKYALSGLEFLDEDWKANYRVLCDLHILAAESAYLTGRYDMVEGYLEPLRQNAENILDRIPAYEIKVEALKAQNKLVEAVDHGIRALNLLNIDLPRQPQRWKMVAKLLSVRVSLLRRPPGKLRHLPAMKDTRKLAAMRLLVAIGPAIYWAEPDLVPHTIFEMVLLSLRYGNTDESVFAYSTYGLLLCGVTGEISAGNRFGRLALHLSESANIKNRVKGVFNVYCFVHHWANPLKDSFSPFEKNFKLGLEAGDLEFAALSAYLYCSHHYYSGIALEEVDRIMSVYGNEIGLLKQETPHHYLLMHWQVVQNLQGRTTDPTLLTGEVYDEKSKLEHHIRANDRTALFKFYLFKMQLSFLFGDYERARDYGVKGLEYYQAATGMMATAVFWFYLGLAGARTSSGDSKNVPKLLGKALRKYKKWSKHAPWSHSHKYALLKAEEQRIKGDPMQARTFYEKAIDHAGKNGFVQEQALGFWLAGQFSLENGEENPGRYYLINAYMLFERWGADALCNELRYRHNLDRTVNDYFRSLDSSFRLNKSRNSFENIDLQAIVRASIAISGELEYDQLIQNLLKVVVENSGAQRGIFLTVPGNEPRREGIWPKPVKEDETDFPDKLVKWVWQTGETINLSNAMEDPTWKQDPFIRSREIKSVFCYPVTYQRETAGIIYLENNITYGTFSVEREEMLQLLSGQIATAIRNASLYKDLENTLGRQVELKEAYSKFVPQNILRFLGKETILEVSLGDQVQEDVSIMFMDIMDYTQLSESMSPKDNFDFINGYLKRVGPHIEQHGGFICQFLGDGFMAIFKENPDEALYAGIQIQKEIRKYNKSRKAKDRKPIQVGIGLHHGPVMLGIIGGELRMDQNVISDHVNIASRIQGLTRFYGASIIVSSTLVSLIRNKDLFNFRKLGKVVLKGKKVEIEVIECIEGLGTKEKNARINNLKYFNEGMMHYYNRNFSYAAMNFEHVLKENPHDKAARFYLNKSAMYISEGIPRGWTGVEVMETK